MTITYTNETNGLSCAFSTATPLMFIEGFDGSSCGAEAVTYKPLEFNGQRFISSNLTARTIMLTVNVGGILNGRYSRKEALKRWDEILRVFVPTDYGTLTVTDGDSTRFIRCRTAESPAKTEILPFLFRSEIQFIADLPLWFDGEENVIDPLPHGSSTVNNPCGLEVPLIIEVPSSTTLFQLVNATSGKQLKMLNTTGIDYTIDTAACTVTAASGELINHMLSVDSEFFGFVPGDNSLVASGGGDVVIRWRKAYMGGG